MRQAQGGIAGVEEEHNCQTGTNTDNGCHSTGDDQSDSRTSDEASPGIDHSIRPGVPAPETVLVAAMADGSYLLMAYPHHEPAAFVTRDDAGLLREALTAAFQSPRDEDSNATGRNESGTRTNTGTVPSAAVPRQGVLPAKQVQP